MRTSLLLQVVLTLPLVACHGSDVTRERLTEVGRARAGNLDVVLLAAQPALKQRDTVTIEFRARAGGFVDVGTVKGSATMLMAGMPPMFGSVEVQRTGIPGRYVATSELSMAGEWRLTLEWNETAGRGSASFSPMVQ